MSLCLLHTGFFLLHALLLTSPRVQCESLPSGKPFLWPLVMEKKCKFVNGFYKPLLATLASLETFMQQSILTSYMRGKEGKKCEANTAVKHISGQVPAASLRAQMTLQGTT